MKWLKYLATLQDVSPFLDTDRIQQEEMCQKKRLEAGCQSDDKYSLSVLGLAFPRLIV